MATVVRPWISLAASPSQQFSTTEMSAAQLALGMKIDAFWYSADLNDGWHTPQMAAIVSNKWVSYATLCYDNRAGILTEVIAGTWDSAITSMATSAIGTPMIVRYFHEMNSPGTNNTWNADPTHYAPAWQRIYGLWRSAGNNSPFLWSPNVSWQAANPTTAEITQYYPGDSYVQYVGLDGYRSQFRPQDDFATQFAPDIAALKTLTSKPIVIGETGADPNVSGRPGWITSMFDYCISEPRIIGLNWWERDNYSLAGDGVSMGAFAAGVRKWRRGQTATIG